MRQTGISAMAVVFLLLASVGVRAEEASLIKNGDFDRDVSGWSFWFAPGEGEGTPQWVKRDGGGALKVDVKRRERSSSVQIYRGPFSVKKDQRYLITFQARADEPFTGWTSHSRAATRGQIVARGDGGRGQGWRRRDGHGRPGSGSGCSC